MDFEGDILLDSTIETGDLVIENGLVQSDKKFFTASYLSLFGGNKEDTGKVKSKYEWWGNLLQGIAYNDKLRSRFQNIITGLPMSVKNVKEAEKAAEKDLEWFIDEGIADKINVTIQTTGKNRFNLIVEIKKDILTIFENTYHLLWGVENVNAI